MAGSKIEGHSGNLGSTLPKDKPTEYVITRDDYKRWNESGRPFADKTEMPPDGQQVKRKPPMA